MLRLPNDLTQPIAALLEVDRRISFLVPPPRRLLCCHYRSLYQLIALRGQLRA